MTRAKEIPIQEQFELSLKTGRVVRLYDEIYIVGDGGFFPIGRLYGGNEVSVVLRGSPFNATNKAGEIAQKISDAGYTIQSRHAEPAAA